MTGRRSSTGGGGGRQSTTEDTSGVEDDTGTDPLATRRRRTALRVLAANRLLADVEEAETEAMDLSELVDAVAECEREASTAEDSRRHHRRAVAAALRFDHLPALETAGVVTVDREAETVRYEGDPELESRLYLRE